MRRRRTSGFTLIEAIAVIVITGIIAGVVATFIAGPVTGYVDTVRRAGLADAADTAARRFNRDMRRALPNSVSVLNAGGVFYVEYLETAGGGRYRYGAGNDLSWTAADASFEVIDTANAPADYYAASRFIAVAPTTTANAYAAARRTGFGGWISPAGVASGACAIAPTALSQICLSPAINLAPVADRPDGERFFVVTTPVTYVCNPNAGTQSLTRYWGYAIRTPAASVPGGAGVQGATLADKVTACTVTQNSALGIVSIWLTLTESGESVLIFSQAQVDNVP